MGNLSITISFTFNILNQTNYDRHIMHRNLIKSSKYYIKMQKSQGLLKTDPLHHK